VAVVVAGESALHLFTMFADGAPSDVVLHGPLFPDLDCASFGSELASLFTAGARLGVDHLSHAMFRGVTGYKWVDASGVLGSARVLKTVDEVACIRHAQLLNELAMEDALAVLRPGVR
ncbi:M24 family metallopeptidase, partial [Mycobacterium kansasii]